MCLKAANLSEMDLQLFGGKSDPYIKVNVDPPEVRSIFGDVV